MYRYSSGTWFGIATPSAAALVPGDLDPTAVAAIHAALHEAPSLPVLLEALAVATGRSFGDLPDFALAVIEPSHVRVAVRGALEAVVAHELVSGAEVSTWSERVLPASEALALRAQGATMVGTLPLVGGVVRCGALEVLVDTPGAGVELPPVVAVPAQAALVAEAEHTPEVAPEADVQPAPTPGVAQGSSDARAEVSSDGSSSDALSSDEDYDLFGPTILHGEEPASEPTQSEPVPAPTPVASDAEPDPHATLLPDHGEDAHISGAAAEAASSPAPVTAPEAPHAVGGSMISGIPSHLTGDPIPGSAPASPPVSSPPPGDHDGETVSVEQLRAMRAAREGAGQTAAGPASGVPVAHAVAALSTGERVTLDRSAIIGRRPKAVRATGDLPHLITVPSPQQDISRSHVELRVEGTAVLAVDLDTTNGTMLRRGSAEPVRLHPHEPTILLGGDVLDLGDGVTATLEGLS